MADHHKPGVCDWCLKSVPHRVHMKSQPDYDSSYVCEDCAEYPGWNQDNGPRPEIPVVEKGEPHPQGLAVCDFCAGVDNDGRGVVHIYQHEKFRKYAGRLMSFHNGCAANYAEGQAAIAKQEFDNWKAISFDVQRIARLEGYFKKDFDCMLSQMADMRTSAAVDKRMSAEGGYNKWFMTWLQETERV